MKILLFCPLLVSSVFEGVFEKGDNIAHELLFQEVRDALSLVQVDDQFPRPEVKQPADSEVKQQVEASEIVCTQGDNFDKETKICTIENQIINLVENYFFERDDIQKILFINSQIQCTKPDQTSCSVTISLKMEDIETLVSFTQGSEIHAHGIYVVAKSGQLYIDGSSTLETNGRSFQERGTDKDNKQGASYIGQGGSCEKVYKDFLYGEFDIMPSTTNMYDHKLNTLTGSIGKSYPEPDRSTGGGGKIYIDVDSLKLYTTYNTSIRNMQLQASGLPLESKQDEDDLNGGSGGYIFINTRTKHQRNWISGLSKINAIGGYGKNKGYGGSGGIIVFNGTMVTLGVDIHGGLGGDHHQGKPCANGSPGTLHWQKDDYLYIDNNGHQTDKAIVLSMKIRNQERYPGQYMIAQSFYISDYVNIVIKNEGISSILFPSLFMMSYSTMKFDIEKVGELTVNYRNFFLVSDTTLMDFTKASLGVRFESIEMDTWYNSVSLGETLFSRSLIIEVARLYVQNSTYDPNPSDNSDIRRGSITFITNEITVMPYSKIEAGKIFIYANESIIIEEGAILNSLIENECHIRDTPYGLFQCMDAEDPGMLSFQQIIYNHNRQYRIAQSDNYYAIHSRDLTHYIEMSWNVYLLSLGTIDIQNTNIDGSRIGICANNITMNVTNVDASSKGCPHDSGLGKGHKINNCAGSGASHGGFGGYGGAQIRNDEQEAKCTKVDSMPYYFGHEARYEGSGGASGDQLYTTGGAGGGVVWITTPDTLKIDNSKIQANGKWGRVDEIDQAGSGGGAGGSIQIITQNLMGNQTGLTAFGGTGSTNGGGGGSGGRLVIHYLRGYVQRAQPQQSGFWEGYYDISGGLNGQTQSKLQKAERGENGTMFGSKCMPGYSGIFCKKCPMGTYKNDYSYGECLPCQNKPKHAVYIGIAQQSSMCDYECSSVSLIERAEFNPDCLDPISLEIQRVGGVTSFFSLLLIFLMVSYSIYFTFHCHTRVVIEKQRNMKDNIYQAWEERDESQKDRPDEKDFSLNDKTIWCHTYRTYLIGQNDDNRFLWQIPKDFPKDALSKQDKDRFLKFIDSYNTEFKPSFVEVLIKRVISIIYPPLAQYAQYKLRQKRYLDLQMNLFRFFPPQFWSDKGDNKSMRLGCSSEDYNLAYIDFLDFSKNRENWLGVKLPMNILLAGAGTFNHPYKINYEEDSYAKSIVLIKYEFLKEKLPIFLENFNSQLGKLSFYKLSTQVQRDLSKTVDWLEKANKALFNHFNVKCVLYIVENQYSESEPGVIQQKRRSFPLESIFFEAFPDMYKVLINYIKQKLISGKSEVRLVLAIKRFDRSKQIKQKMRVERLLNDENKKAYKGAIKRDESVLFDETDSQVEEEKISYITTEKNASNQYLPSFSQEAMGVNTSQVKLINKDKRAFSLSIDSSKAFELAIRKPRNKLKHKFTSFRSSVYGIYLLLMKHHGSPTKSKDFNLVFILYSALVAIDAMVLFDYTMHIFTPIIHYEEFGWAFFWFYFGVPYFSIILAMASAYTGNHELMKLMGNMNSIMIVFNIPLTILMSALNNEDPVYYLVLVFMVLLKVMISGLSAKIRHYIVNPRFQANSLKLEKILNKQQQKKELTEKIIGEFAPQYKSDMSIKTHDEARDFLKMLSTGAGSDQQDSMIRDKLLED